MGMMIGGSAMGITLVIVGGIVVVSLISALFDYKAKQASRGSIVNDGEIQNLRKRVELLEEQMNEKDSRMKLLERDLHFMSRLLEEKPGEK
ncbi:MAG: hypothetical protein E4H20_05605 [Spirochaetales bacterium]|nr:MAG: hypothetical protein E4H20_05605 [Spirochaetales bacterium]